MSSKTKNRRNKQTTENKGGAEMGRQADMSPDWRHKCEVCGQTPIVPQTGLCGPCTFGEADTAEGNW